MCSDDGDGDNENESGSENEEGGNAGAKKSSGEESSGDASDSDSSDMDVEDCDKRREGNRANFHFSLTAAEQCCGSGSGIRCLFAPWISDPGRVKYPDQG